jgi:ribosomal protein L21
MYAIILDGGRQFKVEEGQELTIDFRDLPAGEKLTFDKVLAISTGTGDLKLGAPTVARGRIQSSAPVWPSLATKKTFEPTVRNFHGSELAEPGLMSLTIWVPARVPSEK